MYQTEDTLFSEPLVKYLKSRGWTQMESDPDIAVLRKFFGDQEEEIVLPIDRTYADYRQRVMEAICFLSQSKDIPEKERKRFAFLVQIFGKRGEKLTKKRKAKYTDEYIGKIKVVDDFLPKPEDLVLKEETKKTKF